MSKSKTWHKSALTLLIRGDLTQKAISEKLGVARSTMNDYLLPFKLNPELIHEVSLGYMGPKIWIFDIETAPILGYVWSIWQQNLSIHQIKEDWYPLTWAGKWSHEDTVIHDSLHLHDPAPNEQGIARFKYNEEIIVRSIWGYLDEADFVVAYHAKFDTKKMNAKFVEFGLPPPSPYKIIDPMLTIKANFAFTSNKLDYASQLLGQEGKIPTNWQLWQGCLDDDIMSFEEMLTYNIQDVTELETLWNQVRGWDKRSPNFAFIFFVSNLAW